MLLLTFTPLEGLSFQSLLLRQVFIYGKERITKEMEFLDCFNPSYYVRSSSTQFLKAAGVDAGFETFSFNPSYYVRSSSTG